MPPRFGDHDHDRETRLDRDEERTAVDPRRLRRSVTLIPKAAGVVQPPVKTGAAR